MANIWKYIYGVFALALVTIFLAIGSTPDDKLHLIACDVGQGDGLLAVYKTTQILVDGGPDRKILDCLGKYMPFWDKKIEVILLTHPQIDHYGGLIDVVRSYQVENFIANGLDSDANAYSELKREVAERGIKVTNPTQNTVIRYGSLYLDILWPTKEFLAEEGSENIKKVLGSFKSSRDPNDFSIQAILSLGEFDALLTGDIGPRVIPDVLATGGMHVVDYLKVPHHGSKNGLTLGLLEASSPEIAVISVGRNNRYGHPHEETLKILRDNDIKILRTDELGDIEVVTDGEKWWINN